MATSPDQDKRAGWRYQKELPVDRTNLAKAWKLFESYSGIPPDEIESHVTEVVSVPDLQRTPLLSLP